MPTLELPDLHNIEAVVYLYAVMARPAGPSGDHWAFVAGAKNSVTRKILKANPGCEIRSEAIELVREAAAGPTIEEEIRTFWRDHVTRGLLLRPEIAARLLVMTLSLAEHHAGGALKEKAYRMWRSIADKKHIPDSSRANLVQIFDDFHPVAHLWAATVIAPSLWERRAEGGKDLAVFLGFAEQLRKMGESTPLSQGTLLDPALTWKVPERFILPPWEIPLPTPEMILDAMLQWPRLSKSV